MLDLLGILIGVGIVVLLIITVYVMTGKGNLFIGLIPIIIIVLITVGFGGFCQYKVNHYKTETKSYQVGKKATAEILIKSDEQGQPVAFSHVYIISDKGEVLDCIVLNGNNQSGPYKEIINDITSYIGLPGGSDDIENVKLQVAYFKNAEIAPNEVFICGGILTLMLLGIYVLRLKIFKGDRLRKELIKMKIDSM